MYLKNISLVLLLVIFSSCSSLNPFKENKFYYKNGYQRVQLDTENENIRNIHPIKINPLKIEGALKLIITKYGPKSEPLFQKEKYLPYSVAISEALEEAKPNQDAVFTIEGWYRKKTLSENRVTSGRVFYNKNGLNIIFGSIMRKGNLFCSHCMYPIFFFAARYLCLLLRFSRIAHGLPETLRTIEGEERLRQSEYQQGCKVRLRLHQDANSPQPLRTLLYGRYHTIIEWCGSDSFSTLYRRENPQARCYVDGVVYR